MPQPFKNAVLTDSGAVLLTRSLAGEIQVEFTRLAVGSGVYTDQEKSVEELQKQRSLKDLKNSYLFTDISIHDNHAVKLTALITNQDPITREVLVDNGYFINEIGIYAKEKGAVDTTEVLYSISVTSGDRGDYMPAYNGSPAQITQDFFAMVGNSGEVFINSIGAALLKDGNAKDTTVTFDEADERENIESGEKLCTLFGKIKKFLSGLKAVAFSGSYKDLADKPAIPAAVSVKGDAETSYRTGKVNVTPANIGLGNVGNFKAVSTAASQGLSDTEKANARSNIGAAPTSHASTATTYGASSATNYGHAMASSTTPKANGTAAVGTETAKFARGDHVHPAQTSVSGSSGSCTGNAATATKLATARTFRTNLASTSTASFDGSANITPGVTGTLPVANGGTGKATLTSGQVLVGNGTSAVSQRAIDTTKGGTQNSTSLITSGAVYDTMVFNSINITGTGNLSISSIFAGDYSDLVIIMYADVSGARNMYTWFLPTANVPSSGQLHLISGYKTGNYEGIGEVLITNRTTAKIANCIFGGTQYNTTAKLTINYR